MNTPPNTSRRENWTTIVTVGVFVLAAVGTGFAVYTLLPPLLNGPGAKSSLIRFAGLLVAAFLVVALAARLRRR